MKEITIADTHYSLVSDFKHDESLRKGFNALAKATFDFDFEDYYKSTYWNERYIPYSLADDGKIVANVSVNVLDFSVYGQHKRYIQLGTVMTDPAYRGKGLSRFLLKTVLDAWQNKSEMIYLFANDTVLDFYPKFGFVSKSEFQYDKALQSSATEANVRQLLMDTPQERALLFRLADGTRAFSPLTALRNTGLVMFYATSFQKDNFYYIPHLDAAVFAEYKNDTLHLNDIFSPHTIALDAVVCAMARPNTNHLVLGFTPPDTKSYRCVPYHEADTTLFVRTKNESIFDAHKLMLPILSHA